MDGYYSYITLTKKHPRNPHCGLLLEIPAITATIISQPPAISQTTTARWPCQDTRFQGPNKANILLRYGTRGDILTLGSVAVHLLHREDMGSKFQNDGVIARMYMTGTYTSYDSIKGFVRLLGMAKDGKFFGMILADETVKVASSPIVRVPMHLSMGKMLSTLSGALALVCKTKELVTVAGQFQKRAGLESRVAIEVFRVESRAVEWIETARRQLSENKRHG